MPDASHHLHAGWRFTGTPPVVGVEVEGELDLATVPVLGAAVDRRLGGRPGTLFCDLTRVAFADSQLLHWLLSLRDERATAGGALVVSVALGGPVERLLDLVGLRDELVVVGDARDR